MPRIFATKRCAVLHPLKPETRKYDCVMKTKKILNFLPAINGSVTIWQIFFITDHISNHIIKHYQYFSFLSWIKYSLFVADINYINEVFHENFWVLEMYYTNPFHAFLRDTVTFKSNRSLAYKKILSISGCWCIR